MTHLAAWRRAKNLNQCEAAKLLGFAKSEYQLLESGRVKPTPNQYARLLEHFGAEAKVKAVLRPVPVVA